MSGAGKPPSLVQNERIKLTATALNNVAVATIVTALIAPAASFLYGTANLAAGHWWLVIGVAWLTGGVALHLAARWVLGSLQP